MTEDVRRRVGFALLDQFQPDDDLLEKMGYDVGLDETCLESYAGFSAKSDDRLPSDPNMSNLYKDPTKMGYGITAATIVATSDDRLPILCRSFVVHDSHGAEPRAAQQVLRHHIDTHPTTRDGLKPGARRPRFYTDKGYGQATSTNHLTLLMLGAEGEYDLKPDQRKPRPFTDLGLTFAASTIFCDGVDPDKLSLLETFGPLREDADAAEASKWDEDERYLARREVTVISDEIVYDENGQPRRRIRLSGGCRSSVSGRVPKVACDRQSDSAAWETHPKVVPISPRLLPLADQPKICTQKTVTVYLDMDPQLERSYLGHLYGSSTSQDNLKRARAATEGLFGLGKNQHDGPLNIAHSMRGYAEFTLYAGFAFAIGNKRALARWRLHQEAANGDPLKVRNERTTAEALRRRPTA